MSLILVFVFIALEILRNAYIIHVEKRSPDKRKATLLRIFVAMIITVLFAHGDIEVMAQTGIAALFCFWFFFDYGLNLVDGVKPFYYLNSTGPVDIFESKYPGPFMWFWWKLFLAAMSIYLYFIPLGCILKYREGC